MAESVGEPDRNLGHAFATWVFLLQTAGVSPDDAELTRCCAAVTDAKDSTAGDRAGDALVARVNVLLGKGDSPEIVLGVARRLYGDRAAGNLGEGDRDARLARIRRYQFAKNLPWLARIWERTAGTVHTSWLLIERVTDEVSAMDPNPWNDVDEQRRLPVHDFQVLWELDACSSVFVG